MKALESNAKSKNKLLNNAGRRPGHPFSIILARERLQEQAGAVKGPAYEKQDTIYHLPGHCSLQEFCFVLDALSR